MERKKSGRALCACFCFPISNSVNFFRILFVQADYIAILPNVTSSGSEHNIANIYWCFELEQETPSLRCLLLWHSQLPLDELSFGSFSSNDEASAQKLIFFSFCIFLHKFIHEQFLFSFSFDFWVGIIGKRLGTFELLEPFLFAANSKWKIIEHLQVFHL